MNRKTKTITIIKFLLKRPVNFLRTALTKINLLTTVGFLGIIFKLIKYSGLLFGILSIFTMYIFKIDLSNYFTLVNVMFFTMIGRAQSYMKKALDFLNEFSKPTIETKTQNPWSKTIEQVREYRKVQDIANNLPSKPEPFFDEVQHKVGKIITPNSTNKYEGWVQYPKDHPYITAVVVGSVALIVALYFNSDSGSPGSMAKVAGSWITSVTGFLLGSKGSLEINSNQPIYMSDLENLKDEASVKAYKETKAKLFSHDYKIRKIEELLIAGDYSHNSKDELESTLKKYSDERTNLLLEKVQLNHEINELKNKSVIDTAHEELIKAWSESSANKSSKGKETDQTLLTTQLPKTSYETEAWEEERSSRNSSRATSDIGTRDSSPQPSSTHLQSSSNQAQVSSNQAQASSNLAQSSSTAANNPLTHPLTRDIPSWHPTQIKFFNRGPDHELAQKIGFIDWMENESGETFHSFDEAVKYYDEKRSSGNFVSKQYTALKKDILISKIVKEKASNNGSIESDKLKQMVEEAGLSLPISIPETSGTSYEDFFKDGLINKDELNYVKRKDPYPILTSLYNPEEIKKYFEQDSSQGVLTEYPPTPVYETPKNYISFEKGVTLKNDLHKDMQDIIKPTTNKFNVLSNDSEDPLKKFVLLAWLSKLSSCFNNTNNLTRDNLSDEDLYCLELLEVYQVETILYKVEYKYMIYYRDLFIKLGESVPNNLLSAIKIIENKPLKRASAVV